MATNGVLYVNSKVSAKDITDGTANTIMFGELSWDAGLDMTWLCGNDVDFLAGQLNVPIERYMVWTYNAKNVSQPINSAPYIPTWEERPSPYALHDVSFGSRHPGGCHVLMSDGSSHFLQENVDLAGVLKPMATRASEDLYVMPF